MLPISEIEAFQGKLKSIDEENFDKLKRSILKYGFSFPIFVWNKKILDGHQRLAAVKKLITEGEKVKGDRLPVVSIQARDEKEAAEKLLLINSHYAKIEQEGFELFIENFEIEIEDMSHLLEIPDVVIDFDDGSGSGGDDEKLINKINPNLDEATIEVEKYDKYLINGKHIFICCDLSSDWSHWKDYLKNDDDLFLPYASFYIFHSEKAEEKRFIVLQPNEYVFSKMLEACIEIEGEDSIKKL